MKATRWFLCWAAAFVLLAGGERYVVPGFTVWSVLTMSLILNGVQGYALRKYSATIDELHGAIRKAVAIHERGMS